MKYCKTTTESHPISQKNKCCLESINNVVIREGGKKPIFLFDQIVLNLDEVENRLHRNEKRATMDISFGISKELRDKHIVLTEFKLRHKSSKTIGKEDLVNKVKGSIDLLSRDISIHKEYYFIFTDRLKEEARSHFRSLFLGKPMNSYVPLKLDELNERFFNIS